jgi:hypothetical protein
MIYGLLRGRDSSVSIETGYGVDSRGSIAGRSKKFLSTTQRPDRLWGPLWGQGEARHKKYKRLKLGGGQAYDRSND